MYFCLFSNTIAPPLSACFIIKFLLLRRLFNAASSASVNLKLIVMSILRVSDKVLVVC